MRSRLDRTASIGNALRRRSWHVGVGAAAAGLALAGAAPERALPGAAALRRCGWPSRPFCGSRASASSLPSFSWRAPPPEPSASRRSTGRVRRCGPAMRPAAEPCCSPRLGRPLRLVRRDRARGGRRSAARPRRGRCGHRRRPPVTSCEVEGRSSAGARRELRLGGVPAPARNFARARSLAREADRGTAARASGFIDGLRRRAEESIERRGPSDAPRWFGGWCLARTSASRSACGTTFGTPASHTCSR